MFLSRLALNPRARDVRRDLADCQEMHRSLLAAFPDVADEAARRELGVLYRVEPDVVGTPVVLVQSRARPDWDALPRERLLHADTTTMDTVLEMLAVGRTARFRLLANPTRKIDTKTGADGRRRNGRRVDLRSDDERAAWLGRKAEAAGFAIVPVPGRSDVGDAAVTSEHRVVGRRRHGEDGAARRLTFAAVLFEGNLRVTDADLLRAAIAAGIGTGKAYGFGLLSIALTDGH